MAIDENLIHELDRLADDEKTDVLVYPKQMGEAFAAFLQAMKNEGKLDYNILRLANCVVIKAPKNVVLEIATRDDVSRVTVNQRFTIQ